MNQLDVRKLVGPVAIAAIGLAVALGALGAYEGGAQGTRAFLVICVVIAVAAAVVFGWIVPRGLEREAAGVAALALSALGLLTVAVFWSGLPPILAAGGVLLGWAGLDASRGRRLCQGAIVIGVLALGADLAVYALDWLGNH